MDNSTIAQVCGEEANISTIKKILHDRLGLEVTCTVLSSLPNQKGTWVSLSYIVVTAGIKLRGGKYKNGDATRVLKEAGFIPLHEARELQTHTL